ncbi:hypothetical protein DFJ58DRAFT_723264 [Suillus subalutaceus]|uniref:uncharacterized protein n=1 Tax=Suillus subalutaceus TaxID=48586 RepID=UPI001B87B630|nr:uncharacterized protein DFJ58DRAFT_723264 [Suillus subalutaceus]KAG1869414.1 hypothetical protein DFJ58DRAFT_723264 [Suillus subalutaceus]
MDHHASSTSLALLSLCLRAFIVVRITTIHPNIPSPKDSTNHILRHRLGVMIMALIAPELIHASGSALIKLRDSPRIQDINSKFKSIWKDSKESVKAYDSAEQREILKIGYVDDPQTLTKNQIHDKSKGNAISKGFSYELSPTPLSYRNHPARSGDTRFSVLNFLTYASGGIRGSRRAMSASSVLGLVKVKDSSLEAQDNDSLIFRLILELIISSGIEDSDANSLVFAHGDHI